MNALTKKQKKSHEKAKTSCICEKKFEDKNLNDRKYIAKLEMISLYK